MKKQPHFKAFSLTALLFRLIPAVLCLLVFVQPVASQKKVLYSTPMPAGFASAKISKQLLQKDMQYWQQVMEESHVNPYHAISKTALKQLQQSILDKLPDSVTHFEASFAVSRLIGALDEGHLGFASDPVSDSLFAYTCLRFPYLLQDIDKDGFTVQRDMSGSNKLPAFSRIIEINGIKVQQLYEKYMPFNGGLEPWKKLILRNSIRKLLFMDGIVSPFAVKAVVDKDTVQFTVDGYTRKQGDSLTQVLTAELGGFKPFSLRFLENNIAFIEFNSMNGALKDSFAFFLRNAFTEIQNKKAAGVIIDLRKNGGGDSGLGDTLISYISDKPYCNASGMKMRISKHSKANAKLRGNKDPFETWKNGSLYEYKVKELIKPEANPLRYQGKVAVLIGTGTFSSANMLTNAIKDFKLATLVGEQTAEPANDFGEIFPFMLPNTYIVATTAIKMFIRANGDDKDFTGIKPDIEASNSYEDILQKKDRVVDAATAWIIK